MRIISCDPGLQKLEKTRIIKRKSYYNFKCICGNIVEKRGDTKTKTCCKPGCKYSSRKCNGKANKNNYLYRKWEGMISRCHNKSHASHVTYFKRGIIVCDEWRHDFTKFEKWALDNGSKKGLDIDRRDIDGNYEPSNCRFITRSENVRQQHLDGHGSSRKIVVSNGVEVLDFNSVTDFHRFLIDRKETTVVSGTLSHHINKKGRFNDWTVEDK